MRGGRPREASAPLPRHRCCRAGLQTLPPQPQPSSQHPLLLMMVVSLLQLSLPRVKVLVKALRLVPQALVRG